MRSILSIAVLATSVSAWGLKHRAVAEQWSVDHPQPVEWSDWDEQWYKDHPEEDLVSAPLERRQSDGGESPDAKGMVNITYLNMQIARNERKWAKKTQVVTQHVVPANQRHRRAGPVGVTFYDDDNGIDGLWIAPLSIGTPPQKFKVFIDTGSSELTIPNASCTNCGSKTKFNPSASSTFFDTGKKISTSYANASPSVGEWVTETVTFGSSSVGYLSAPNQAVLLASSISTQLTTLPVDGLMGMAWAGLAVTKSNSTPFSLYGAGASNFFSLRLTDKVGFSYLNMGVSRTLVGSLPRYYTITMNGGNAETYWQIRLSAPNVNGVVAIEPRATHIFDSGTQYIVAPVAAAKQFWAKVPGSAPYVGSSNFYTYPCATPPKVSFTMYRTANSYAVPEYYFNLGFTDYNSSLCVGAVVAQNLGIGINGTSWILGETFYKGWLVIHNMATTPSIGLVVPKDRATVPQKRSIWANKRSFLGFGN